MVEHWSPKPGVAGSSPVSPARILYFLPLLENGLVCHYVTMNDDTISDLKDFITATFSQQTATLREEIRGDIRQDIRTEIDKLDIKLSTRIDNLDEKLSTRIDDLSAAVAEALDNQNDAVDLRLADHEARIGVLEAKV